MRYTCYFDGCITYNPFGDMGLGAIIIDSNGEIVHEFSDFIPESDNNSNNVAEAMALQNILVTLLEIVTSDDSVEIKGDSKIIINAIVNKYHEPKGLFAEYVLDAKNLFFQIKNICKIYIKWIPREENTLADELSRKMMPMKK